MLDIIICVILRLLMLSEEYNRFSFITFTKNLSFMLCS